MQGLDRNTVMARQRTGIDAVGHDAVSDQHAIGTGAGFGRAQFGCRDLRRRYQMPDAVNFRAAGEPGTNPCVVQIRP
jgi:hypothetical protein